ncbi:MAG: phosphate ABC transporter permease PstA [Planctomycetes bacterium]|nr:phosphate ABC transporter permease PstA [Planctomycetota bacterium]
MTGFVTRVTVEGEVIADIEKDGRDKVLEVFLEQQQVWHEKYEKRYSVEKYDLGSVNFDLKDSEDTLKRIRYEHRDSRDIVAALDELEIKFKEWQAMEPLDKDYPTTEEYDVARAEWLDKLPAKLNEWQDGLAKYNLSEEETTPLERAREVQEARAKIQAEDFARLRYEVNSMRNAEAEATFTFETPDGMTTELVLAHVVRAFQPNELGLFGKLGTYGARVWEFLTDDPREANTEGGIWPVIIGTLIMTLLMCFAVVPFGVVAALYLREYAKQGPIVSAVRIAVNNLAGVPSIVFGIFGLGFFCVMMGGTVDDLFFPELQPAPVFGGGGIMWAALTLALLTVPVVIVSTEEALSAVPSSQREASLACGASKFQTVWKVVLPQALPGVLTGTILAMARGAGEVAPLMLVGAVKYAPFLPADGTPPFIHLERKFMHLGFHIYDVGFQSPNVDNTKPLVFATALVLIMLVAVLNVFAIRLRNKLRKKFATSHV